MPTLIERLRDRFIYPLAYSYVSAQSVANYCASLTKRDTIHFEREYGGEKVVLLAMYEKGFLRNDVKNLLTVLKAQGVYTICVNTLKLKDPMSYETLIDCYIERFNFGRDFGSYKNGFRHFYRRRMQENCPRLLLINDSVFYSRKNLPNFISDLLDSDIEVLGATENHEIEHHLGSFCIAIAGTILRKEKFQKFWKRYRQTDVRPAVIKRGEMGLSKVMRRCVTSPENFRALFDLTTITEYLRNNPGFLEQAHDYHRTSELVDWPKPSLNAVVSRLITKYVLSEPTLNNTTTQMKYNFDESKTYFVDSPRQTAVYLKKTTKFADINSIKNRVYHEIENSIIDCYAKGSQIHQNGILLIYLGLPIIKIDGLYRGMFATEDVRRITKQLDADDKISFMRLIFSKPFGGNVLFGWKRAAFYRGLI
jgi:hypothetical protein